MTIAIIFVAALMIGVVLWVLVLGGKQDAAWQQLAGELGAEFVKGGFFRSAKVRAQVKDRTVTLDTYSVPSGDTSTKYTRMTAPIRNKDGLEFTLGRKGWVAKLDKALGAKDIEIGDADFDRDYVIRGNNEQKVKVLFANQRLRELIQAQRSITLMLNATELKLEATGVIKDIERLGSFFEMFKLILDRLEG